MSAGPPGVPSWEAPHEARQGRRTAGRCALGLLLVLAGVGWLLDEVDAANVPWHLFLPVALMLIGTALLAGARAGRDHRLIAIGIALTILLAVLSIGDVRVQGPIGDRTFTPTSVSQVGRSQRVAAGTLTIDLGRLSVPYGTTVLEASVGMGDLRVTLPAGSAVRIHARAGAGKVRLLERERSGIGVEDDFQTDDFEAASSRLDLDLSVGFGSIEVTR